MAALQGQLFQRNWVDRGQYGLVYGLARVTPGTNILALCAGTGWLVLGGIGAVLAVVGSSFPSSLMVMGLTAGYVAWRQNLWAMAAITGMLAAATGLMCVAAFGLLKPHFKTGRWIRAVVIFGVSLGLALRFGLTPVHVLALAAIAGALWV